VARKIYQPPQIIDVILSFAMTFQGGGIGDGRVRNGSRVLRVTVAYASLSYKKDFNIVPEMIEHRLDSLAWVRYQQSGSSSAVLH
jgi:hypothetical protein